MSQSEASVIRSGGMIALAAALPAEMDSIAKLGTFKKARLGNMKYFRGVIRGTDAALFVSGVGSARAYDTAKAACTALPVSAYISVGFSAALSESLKPGDVVVGVKTARPAGGDAVEYPSDEGLVELARAAFGGEPGLCFGGLLTADRVAVTADEKRGIAAKAEAVALDMETAGAAKAAAEQGVPFLAVRAISDALDEGLPVDFNEFMKGGDIDWPPFLMHIITHPRTIPGLMRLGRSSNLASRNLALALRDLLAPPGPHSPHP